jgi:hypothetical protein
MKGSLADFAPSDKNQRLMTEPKGLGSKLLGLFVEREANDVAAEPGGEREKTAAELVAELAGQATAPQAPAAPSELQLDKLAIPSTGVADFDLIFRKAGMDAGELDRVRKAEELLKSLPEATPQGVKKQIVEASLKAFGFEVEKIVLAAQNQQRALDTYFKVNETATATANGDAEDQIRQLTEKIAQLQKDIEQRSASLQLLSASASSRKEQVQKVLNFFHAPAVPGTSR